MVYNKLIFFLVDYDEKIFMYVIILFGCCLRKFVFKKINYYDINGVVNIDFN